LPKDKTAAVCNQKTETNKVFGISTGIAATIVLVSPIVYVMAIAPDTFSLSWNQGRGGFLFAMAFIAAELIGVNYAVSKRRLAIAMVLAVLSMVYFTALDFGLRTAIQNAGPEFHVAQKDSWQWFWDFVVMSIFVTASLVAIFGKNWYKLAPAGAIYLIGTAVILSLDAFFPYDTLGPLQFIVPIYLQIDNAIIHFIDQYITNIGPADPNSPGSPSSTSGNVLILNGLHGPFALQVFWPSAGVHSMIIYTLVMLALLLKMDIPRSRKLVYFAIGTFGTAAVNVVRITSLSLYALIVTTNVGQWEAFHSVAGEIMFLPWLGVYLGIVMYTERAIRKAGSIITTVGTAPPGSQSESRLGHANDDSSSNSNKFNKKLD
jgi:thaumarchaeosortase